ENVIPFPHRPVAVAHGPAVVGAPADQLRTQSGAVHLAQSLFRQTGSPQRPAPRLRDHPQRLRPEPGKL
ncbi:MAG: hypothetical protein AVDCRST_MAG56-8077, partial [uncultured Cytophagales bacterium]